MAGVSGIRCLTYWLPEWARQPLVTPPTGCLRSEPGREMRWRRASGKWAAPSLLTNQHVFPRSALVTNLIFSSRFCGPDLFFYETAMLLASLPRYLLCRDCCRCALIPDNPLGGSPSLRDCWRSVCGHFCHWPGVHRASYGLFPTGKTVSQPASPSSRVLMGYLG